MGGIYEIRHSEELRCHDTHTKFHKDWFRHSKVRDRQHGHHISLLLSSENKENGLKMVIGEIEWGGTDWTVLARDRDQWREDVNTVRNFRVP
jgi:hypothetical protein